MLSVEEGGVVESTGCWACGQVAGGSACKATADAGKQAPSLKRGRTLLSKDAEALCIIHERFVTGGLLYAAKGHLGT